MLSFLKNKKNNFYFQGQTISNTYVRFKFNLSLTDKSLQNHYGQNDVEPNSIETDNIPLLQEIAFIQNKEAITKHICNLKKEHEKEIESLRV